MRAINWRNGFVRLALAFYPVWAVVLAFMLWGNWHTAWDDSGRPVVVSGNLYERVFYEDCLAKLSKEKTDEAVANMNARFAASGLPTVKESADVVVCRKAVKTPPAPLVMSPPTHAQRMARVDWWSLTGGKAGLLLAIGLLGPPAIFLALIGVRLLVGVLKWIVGGFMSPKA